MSTFQYARKDGSLGTISAADANTALRMLPADADPHSGVQSMLSGTGAPAPGSAPAPSPLPGGTPALPSGGGATGGSPLLSFANQLDAAVNLARQSRNKSSLDIMGPYRGTVMASDFNSILGHLNEASDTTSADLIKNAKAIATPDLSGIITATSDNGDVHGIDKATGKLLWTTPGVGNKQGNSGASGVLLNSGALAYTKADYSEDASALEQSRGQDGWVDPSIYQKLYDAWVANGGKIADFVKTYPPATYVNPENDWLPIYLRPKKSGGVNPFAT